MTPQKLKWAALISFVISIVLLNSGLKLLTLPRGGKAPIRMLDLR